MPRMIAGSLVAVAAVTAAAVTWCAMRTAQPPLQLEVRVTSPSHSPPRALLASAGDMVVVRAAGADHIWIYRDRVTLVMRCTVTPRFAELSFRIDAVARYQVLAVAGPLTLEPSGDLDRDVDSARSAGARLELRSIQARAH